MMLHVPSLIFLLFSILGIISGGPISLKFNPAENFTTQLLESSPQVHLPLIFLDVDAAPDSSCMLSKMDSMEVQGPRQPSNGSEVADIIKDAKKGTMLSENPLSITQFMIWETTFLNQLGAHDESTAPVPLLLVSPYVKISVTPGWKTSPFKLYMFSDRQSYDNTTNEEVEINSKNCLDDMCTSLLVHLPGVNVMEPVSFLKFAFGSRNSKPYITFRTTFDPLRSIQSKYFHELSPQEVIENLLHKQYDGEPGDITFRSPKDVFKEVRINNEVIFFSETFLNVAFSTSESDGENIPFTFAYKPKKDLYLKDCIFQVLKVPRVVTPFEISPTSPYLEISNYLSSHSTVSSLDSDQENLEFLVPSTLFKEKRTPLIRFNCKVFKSNDTNEGKTPSVNVFLGFEKEINKTQDTLWLPRISLPYELSLLSGHGALPLSTAPKPIKPMELLESFLMDGKSLNILTLSRAFSQYYKWDLTPNYRFMFILDLKMPKEFTFSVEAVLLSKDEDDYFQPTEFYQDENKLKFRYSFDVNTFLYVHNMLAEELDGQTLHFKFALTDGLVQATWSIFICASFPKP